MQPAEAGLSTVDRARLTFRGTGGDALARQLALEGTEVVFGVPGVQLDFGVDAIARDGRIDFLHTRHEQAASFMADGYARSTGRIGVCMVVPGPGVLNAASGLATAYACSSRVLCLAGQIPSPAIGRSLGLLHEIPDQSRILASLTKWSGFARSVEDVPGLVRRAFHELRSGRPRPVALEIPPDVLEAEGSIELVDPSSDADAPLVPDSNAIERAATLAAGASRPVIWAGGGVIAAGASAALVRLATQLRAPVITTVNGRGAIDSTHSLALTSLGGRAALRHADVVLVVGSRFVDARGAAVQPPAGAKVILLNAEPSDLEPPRRCDVAILGDACLGLAALADTVQTSSSSAWRPSEIEAIRAWTREQVDALGAGLRWVQALREGIPDDGILVSELTQVGLYCEVAYPVYTPRTFMTSGYQGTLGYGFPTALGAAAAGQARVVSITGDGGFGWGLSELSTAAKHGIPLITVVFDDGAFGNVRRIQRDRFAGRLVASDLDNPDFVALAASFGIDSVSVATPTDLRAALDDALARPDPALVHVPVGDFVSPWHLIHDFVRPPVPAPARPELTNRLTGTEAET